MPSWNDSESSGRSWIGELSERDYAPDMIDVPSFRGKAADCPEVCRVHRLEPQKCVAFEGSNTGRRFYMCSVLNEVSNCGFVSWLDDEWPETLKYALAALWGKYDDINTARIDVRIAHGKLIQERSEEKNKADKKYTTLLDDVKKFIDTTEKQVMQENLAKMKQISDDPKLALTEFLKKEAEKEVGEMRVKIDLLKNELHLLKELHKADKELMKFREDKWDAQKEEWKEEKKYEYMLFDLLKVSDGNKDRLKRIKQIVDE